MSTLLEAATHDTGRIGTRPSLRDLRRRALTIGELARVQGKRMLRSPVLLVGAVWTLLGVGLDVPDTPYEAYIGVTGLVIFVVGPFAFFAANLVASSERRSGAAEWLPSAPLEERDRVSALLLACLAPSGLSLALSGAVYWLAKPELGLVAPTWKHMASVPLTVLGGAVLGVAVSRLLPWTGAPMLVMVALVVFNFYVSERERYLGFYVDFAQWTESDATPALAPGSPGWHVVYVAALVGLAASGAYLRSARRPWLPYVSGAAFGTLVLVAGVLQLP